MKRTISFLVLAVAPLTIASAQDNIKKVSPAEAIEAILSKPAPEYPPMAKQLRIQGNVELEAVVAENGTVEKVTVVSGNPVLTKPAAEGVKKWKFKPFQSEGKPVKALAPVVVKFNM